MKPLMSLVSCLLLSLGLISCSSHFPAGLTKLSTQQIVNHEGYSTVALVHYDLENDDEHISDIKPYCSAVWVDSTHILTAYHCVHSEQKRQQERQDKKELDKPICSLSELLFGHCDPDAPVPHKTVWMNGLSVHFIQWKEVDDYRKEPTAWHLSKVVGWDESKDLALIEAVGGAIPPHEVATLADTTPALGDKVYVCGHPRGFYWTFLDGTVAGYRRTIRRNDQDTGPYMQAQVPVYYGNSGGGAFDSWGHLVGIADMLVGLPAEGLFVHLDNLRAFLQGQTVSDKLSGVAPHEEPSPAPKKEVE